MTMGDWHKVTSALPNLQCKQKNDTRNSRGLGHKKCPLIPLFTVGAKGIKKSCEQGCSRWGEGSKASPSLQASVLTGLYPVTGITGGVGCPSNDLVFQGTASVRGEGDFLTECMSTPAFSYDHKKNNILQQGDKVCSTKVTQQRYSKQNPSFLTKCWIKVWR